jgi:hydrogenase-4 component E
MSSLSPLLENVNALVAGLFLLTAFGMVGMRQVLACLRMFVANGLLLALSAFIIGALSHSWHVLGVGVIELVSKPILIPWVLRQVLPSELYVRREIEQALNIPTSLLISLSLAVAAYFFAMPLLRAGDGPIMLNLPIGFAVLLVGAFTIAVRREAVPMLLGLLTMENAAFFAGIAVAAELPLFAEVAIAFDVLGMVFIVGVLTRMVHKRVGTTDVSVLTRLREEGRS